MPLSDADVTQTLICILGLPALCFDSALLHCPDTGLLCSLLRLPTQGQLAQLYELYADWNTKINVISRKDIENLYEHHVLHSLAIGKALRFKPGTKVLDFGTGGGFPGIPLAILFPEVDFKLIDGTGKKIRVTTEVAQAVGLKNVKTEHLRGENERGQFDFVVSRA